MHVWNPLLEMWIPIDFDRYDRRWWFEVVPGAWAYIRVEHVKTISGRRFVVCTHPTLPGRYLGYYLS